MRTALGLEMDFFCSFARPGFRSRQSCAQDPFRSRESKTSILPVVILARPCPPCPLVLTFASHPPHLPASYRMPSLLRLASQPFGSIKILQTCHRVVLGGALPLLLLVLLHDLRVCC